MTGGAVASYGATSMAGTAMITVTGTVMAKTTEVVALQIRKSFGDGDNGWQIVNDCINSVFNNGGRIITPTATKVGTTSANYLVTDIAKHKVVPLGANAFLNSKGGKVLPYAFVAGSWIYTINSIFSCDPVVRAKQRGYSLV